MNKIGNKFSGKVKIAAVLILLFISIPIIWPAAAGARGVSEGDFTVTLTVRADTLIDNPLLDPDKRELVPEDGVIFQATEVNANEGDSVFDVLLREMQRARIHMEFSRTTALQTAYVMGINNLYEFDAGPLSGWKYKVNGEFPNFGSSQYFLGPEDEIQWLFTTDLGRDIDGFMPDGGQWGR